MVVPKRLYVTKILAPVILIEFGDGDPFGFGGMHKLRSV